MKKGVIFVGALVVALMSAISSTTRADNCALTFQQCRANFGGDWEQAKVCLQNCQDAYQACTGN
jgi:hypothetical protein